MRRRDDSQRLHEGKLDELRDLPAVTRDGARVSSCWATSSFRRRADHCLDRGAEGVGLYRTEFLYLDKHRGSDGGRAFRGLSDRAADAGPEAARGDSHPRPGSGQVPAALGNGPARAQPVPGIAQRPALSAEFDLVQNANACHSESKCVRRRADHVPHDQHACWNCASAR